MEISSIQARLQAFSAERNWEQYHSPKNLAMALAVEAAELMEIFQWVGAEESRNIVNHPDKMEQVGAELADVCVYAIRLADVTGIDVLPYEVDVANERLQFLEQQSGRKLQCEMHASPILQYEDAAGFDIIWLEQAFHHLEPRAEVVTKLGQLLRPGGKIIFSEANALNPLLQLQIFLQRGFKTTVEVRLEGHTTIWGNERILSASALEAVLEPVGIRKAAVRYFRVFPSHPVFNQLFALEERLTAMSHLWLLAPVYSHYNFVGVKT